MRPQPGDYAGYFGTYINLVEEDNLESAFAGQAQGLRTFLESISTHKWEYKYAEDKWTVKELIQHCIDTERVFAYRAMCFARKEAASLPSFDENQYAGNSQANRRSPQDLIEEYVTLRTSTELMYRSFTEEMLASAGVANNSRITVLSLGYTLLGHFYHHKRILEERYFN
jgi:hypothetical protein